MEGDSAKPERKKAPPKPRAAPTMVKELVAALAQPDVARQVRAIDDAFADVPADKRGASAAAALKGKTGASIARAYLSAVAGDADAAASALAIARHTATMTRGWEAMRGAFVASWRHCADPAAIDGAVRNLSRVLLDDPEVLAASVEAAQRLGDAATLKKRTARLERATRLAPLVARLAGDRATRAAAVAELDALPPPDRLHVHAQVVAAPRRFDPALAVAAMIALADDPRVPDAALVAAVGTMRGHGLDDLVAAWRTRVAEGDGALINRLLTLFEWTALAATQTEQLAPLIRALQPASGKKDVFTQVENALASDSAVLRCALCEEWLRDDAMQAFDEAQLDKLWRALIALAELGNDTPDRRAACQALFHASLPGTRRALIDAIRHARPGGNKDLKWSLYFGLAHIDHPEVVPFLVERLFAEREAYGAVIGALGVKFDAGTHRRVLSSLANRADDPDAPQAAALYAEVLVDRDPRLLIELARTVIGWKPKTKYDGRRMRYVFERASAVALANKSPVDARPLLARARELPDPPYSDYWAVDRDEWTPAPFTEPVTQQRIAALDAGKLVVEGRTDPKTARTRTILLVCRNRVASFARWKRVFDSHRAAHRAAGLTLRELGRGVDDPNQVYFVFEADDLAKARAFIAAPDAKDAGKTAGVLDGEYHLVERG